MMDCIADDSGKTCRTCGWTWQKTGPFPHHNCTGPPRTDEEMATLSALCRTNDCGAFDWHPQPEHDACRMCGCAKARRANWQAQLRHGHCPKQRW